MKGFNEVEKPLPAECQLLVRVYQQKVSITPENPLGPGEHSSPRGFLDCAASLTLSLQDTYCSC